MVTSPSNSTQPLSPKTFLRARAKPASRLVRGASFFALLSGLFIIAGAWALAYIVDRLIFAGATAESVAPYIALLVVAYLLRALCVYMAEYCGARAALTIKSELRGALLTRLLSAQGGDISRERTGVLINSLTEGLDALHGYYARYLPAMSVTVMLPLAILFFVFPVDWISGVVMLVTAPLIPFFMILIGRGAERLNQRQWRRLALLSGHFLDVVQGLTTLKLFGASKREAHIISRMSEEYRNDTMAILRIAFLSSLALEFFATVSIAIVAVLVGFRLLWGHVSFEHAYLVLLLAPEFYLPLRRMGTHYHARMEAIGAAEKLTQLLAPLSPSLAATQPAPAHAPRIVFDRVTFGYDSETPVLRDISFTLEPGHRLAVIGPSGGGKSTLLALLLGLLEPQSGEIRIDDVPLNAIDRDSWWHTVAWVAQRPHLSGATVEDAILAGREGDVTPLASALGIDFLSQTLGERAQGISGGQMQRAAVARALLHPSCVLVMDEPTAGLDASSETQITAAIEQAASGRSIVTAAHRLHTVIASDVILLLDKGEIVAQGHHTQLHATSEAYRIHLSRMEAA